jgi:hypothetical protein
MTYRVKHQNKQKIAERRRRQDAEILSKAHKAAGTKSSGMPGLNAAADIAALEKYLKEIAKLRAELTRKYGHLDLGDVLFDLRMEEKMVLDLLTKIKIGQIEPHLSR